MVKTYPGKIFDFFGPGYDRYAFPGPIKRVTGGHGGEVYLIVGSQKTAIIDCGMAYCGKDTADNIRYQLGARDLDYIFLTHSHYDHMGALPYIKDCYPNAVVMASAKCAKVLSSPGAKSFIKDMGETAKLLYAPDSNIDIRIDNLEVGHILNHGEVIDIGNGSIACYETKGHTDCSMSFMVEPWSVLFASESTGILEGRNYVHTPILKSFTDGLKSLELCESLNPEYICNPHFGLLPRWFNNRYYELYREEVRSKAEFIGKLMNEGLTFDEIYGEYCDKYWDSKMEEEQPFEAFAVNSKYIILAMMSMLEGDKDV